MALTAADVPGLLAEVAGVLHANRINIVDAAIYSRVSNGDKPDKQGEALDIFRVRDSYGRPVTDDARWTKIRSDLEAVISGKVKVETLVAGRTRGDSLASWKVPEVPTEVKIDNQGSRNFTIVEVITGDYPGVLYAIAQTLFALWARHPSLEDRDRSQPGRRYVLPAGSRHRGKGHRRECDGRASGSVASVAAADHPLTMTLMSPLILIVALLAEPGPSNASGKSSQATVLLEKGSQLFKQGDIAGALQAFDGAAKADPTDARPHYLRGWRWKRKATRRAPRRPTAPRSHAGRTLPRRTTTWERCCWAKPTRRAPRANSRRR